MPVAFAPYGQAPSLHRLRSWIRFHRRCRRLSLGCVQRFRFRARVGITIAPLLPRPNLVRRLRRYNGPVRLPPVVRHRWLAMGLPDASRRPISGGRPGDLPVLAQEDSARARGLRPRRVNRHLALSVSVVQPSASSDNVGTLKSVISRLDTLPMRAPVNASPMPSRAPAHDSGSSWVATPSM